MTFGLNTYDDFTNFQISDLNEIFSTDKSVLVQGEIPIYESKLKDKLKLISIGQVLAKTRKSLVGEHYRKYPVLVRARSNEAFHVNKLLSEMFVNKGLEFKKFKEESLSEKEIDKRLIEANENLSNLIKEYEFEIRNQLKI